MVDVMVAVEATARSPFAPDPGEGSYDLSSPLSGYPVGEGYVPDSLAEDGGPVPVLVLMEEPARPGQSVRARPVALLHTVRDSAPCDEVVCVPAGDAHFAALTDPEGLRAWHADEDGLAAVLGRFHPGLACQITGYADRRLAELLLGQAHHAYERLTGSLE